MSGTVQVNTRAREASIEAIITRADGSVEIVGVVSYWHKNPLRRWWWHFSKLVWG